MAAVWTVQGWLYLTVCLISIRELLSAGKYSRLWYMPHTPERA